MLTEGEEETCRPDSGGLLRVGWNRGETSPLSVEGAIAIDCQAKLRQILSEVWRALDGRFYDPAMRRRDWVGARARDGPRLAGRGTAAEARELILTMVGELEAVHADLKLAPAAAQREDGDLGLVARVDAAAALGVVRVREQDPAEAISTSAEEAPRVRVGDRLLSVDGISVGPGCPVESLLVGAAGRDARVEFGPRSGGQRAVTVHAISAADRERLEEQALVAARAARARREGGGRLAYLRLSAVDERAATRIEAALRPSGARPPEGLVLDRRGNLGGYGRDAVLVAPGIRRPGLGARVGATTGGGLLGSREERMIEGSRFHVQVLEAGWHGVAGARLEMRGVEPETRVENRFGATVAEDAPFGEALRRARGEGD